MKINDFKTVSQLHTELEKYQQQLNWFSQERRILYVGTDGYSISFKSDDTFLYPKLIDLCKEAIDIKIKSIKEEMKKLGVKF